MTHEAKIYMMAQSEFLSKSEGLLYTTKLLFKIVGFYEPQRSFILIYFISWRQRVLKQIAGGKDCEDLWNWEAFTVGVVLSAVKAISVLLFLCVAVKRI
jgi:hypothetical protein